MVQRSILINAVIKDVPTKSSKGEYVKGMVQISGCTSWSIQEGVVVGMAPINDVQY